MASDSENEILEGMEFDGEDDPDAEAEEEHGDMGNEDGTEDGDDDSGSEDSDDVSDDDEDDDDSELNIDIDSAGPLPPSEPASAASGPSSRVPSPMLASPPLIARKRSLSPAELRRRALLAPIGGTDLAATYAIEAICALPHPVPTHALASSWCMTHLLTGSDDGYIRNYDIFSAVNGKNFLTAPQRHHSGVVEGIMKSGQLRFWWENPPVIYKPNGTIPGEEEPNLSPVYSLAMQSDALWALAGTDVGHINLFTVRHDPGRLCHVIPGHRGPVSALSMDFDEKSFFSAGWDGEATQWDLNTGQRVRNFTAHGAQLAGIAVRPAYSNYSDSGPAVSYRPTNSTVPSQATLPAVPSVDATVTPKDASSETVQNIESQQHVDSDAKSDASFDPLFDDEPEEKNMSDMVSQSTPAVQIHPPPQSRTNASQIPPPKNAPPLLDSVSYTTYSPDLLMTAAIDGQVILWDRRSHTPGQGVGRLWMHEKTPPWCLSACWSADGNQLYAGRRNGAVDVWDVRQLGRSGPANTPRLLGALRNPLGSGVVSCVVAFPDCKHIACASNDNLRLWNVADAADPDAIGKLRSGAQFKIIPGHHGGYISQMLIDPGARFLVSASSNRGWHGDSTRTVFVHDIKRS